MVRFGRFHSMWARRVGTSFDRWGWKNSTDGSYRALDIRQQQPLHCGTYRSSRGRGNGGTGPHPDVIGAQGLP